MKNKIVTAKTKKILFLNDDKALLDSIHNMIQPMRYEASVTGHSITAINLLKSQPDSFDLVIIMNMPLMNGIALSKALLTIKPDLPIIICSGDSISISDEFTSQAGVRGVLPKSFTFKDLENAIQDVLA